MKRINGYHKATLLFILCFSPKVFCFCQYPISKTIWNKLISVEKDTALSTKEKLQAAQLLKRQFQEQKLSEDSVYARVLHRIALYEYLLNDEIPTKNTLLFTQTALRINSAGKQGSSPAFCVNSYTNLGNYYKSLQMYGVASRYYDSAVVYRRRYAVPEVEEATLLLAKVQMLLLTGDYQLAAEELNLAIAKAKAVNDEYMLQALFNQRAQAYLMQGRWEPALNDVNQAMAFSSSAASNPETTNSLMLKARILASKKNFATALPLFHKAIRQRLQTDDYIQIADDYTDLGNVYLEDLHNYKKAKECYLATIRYASQGPDKERLAKGHINLQYCSFNQQNLKESETYCVQAFRDLDLTVSENIFFNPTARQVSTIGNKELILVILGNKVELLVSQFTRTGNKDYLKASLQTALLADTLITTMRHEQTGEQSKLYWREWTRELYGHALEACYLHQDASLAFYFMEKSRAVLLNDKLNELGAAAYLPSTEAARERDQQIAVITEQQKLSMLSTMDDGFIAQQAKLSEAKVALEHYVRSLEKRYPAYYQYKYADEVPSLKELQTELRKREQNFIYYFTSDTAGFILNISPTAVQLVKLSKQDFSPELLARFLQLCADEVILNNRYTEFAQLSHSLFKRLFQPLQISKGRVVICSDNFFIPFEALAKDSKGTDFLLADYQFSYVYSGRYFLRQFRGSEATGSFIGFAPVSFNNHSGVPDLKSSGEALQQSASHYNAPELLIRNQAARSKFIHAAPHYSVINVFSHAQADTTENEPVLYLYDSLIRLSELFLLRKPATELIVLSACQTNIGKAAKGEGIFSLARGFATAGIPSVAATLWKADEQTIYAISEKFHEYLSKGMLKDEALQKAKLYFIHNGSSEKPLPYYWANMILVGNAEPIEFSKNGVAMWWIAGVIFLALVIFIILFKRHFRQALAARCFFI